MTLHGVLGIDPGLTRCGVGLVAGSSSRPQLLHAECLRTRSDVALEQRLLQLHSRLELLIDEYRPSAIVVERVLFSANVRTAMATGQAAGAALLAGARAGVPVTAYSPTQIKLTVAGDGSATKAAVGRMVAAQLGLASAPEPADVADAIAVAITHLAMARIDQAGSATPAAGQLAAARAAAAATGRSGWEAIVAQRQGSG
ncbi:MAG: crossover junction endodeoxyribonuclease RuvC [Nitriliruptoraceae bacterium]